MRQLSAGALRGLGVDLANELGINCITPIEPSFRWLKTYFFGVLLLNYG